MAVNEKHPDYLAVFDDWVTMRDVYGGEGDVKDKSFRYLPPTEGQVADGIQTATQRGAQAYRAYKMRAELPDYVERAVESALGVMHNRPATIKLPAEMESMRESATVKGESLEQLLQRINEEQLITGRIGLLADVAVDPAAPTSVLPYIATYDAETIINWDDGTRDELTLQNLNLVVLDESEQERQPETFAWEHKEKYRVLVLGDPNENEGSFTRGSYRAGVFRETDTLTFTEDNMVEPSVRGQTLDFIPFTFINSKDLLPCPDKIPGLGLARLTLTSYRKSADYNQSLFMQGQDTFVVIGTIVGSPEGDEVSTTKKRVGAGSMMQLSEGGDAKYVGVTSEGLSEQRESLQNNDKRATQMTGNLLDTESRDRESGDALRIRRGAQTASLTMIALTGAAGLEQELKFIAQWIGANPDEVEVKPNMDFANDTMSGKELTDIQTAKMLGAPIAEESIHQLMKERGLTQLEFPEEKGKIGEEVPNVPPDDTRGMSDDNDTT